MLFAVLDSVLKPRDPSEDRDGSGVLRSSGSPFLDNQFRLSFSISDIGSCALKLDVSLRSFFDPLEIVQISLSRFDRRVSHRVFHLNEWSSSSQ